MTALLAPGFGDPVLDSQATFRLAMEALSRPGRVRLLPPKLGAEAPLPAAAAALILTLCDFETSLHVSPSLAARSGLTDYLAFHTGARLTPDAGQAAFALIDLAADPLDLGAYAQGTPAYPDRSTTVIALAATLEDGPARTIAGPGIAATERLAVAPLPADFAAQWGRNRQHFPLGVDLIFVAGSALVGLPRSARILEEAR